MNKFLHPPIQALKQAAREGDSARLDALCDEWAVSPAAQAEPQPAGEPAANAEPESPSAEAPESKRIVNLRVIEGGSEARR